MGIKDFFFEKDGYQNITKEHELGQMGTIPQAKGPLLKCLQS
jgi:hypothetical protein